MTKSIAAIRTKFLALKPVMDERLTRLWAGAEADAIGDGGITIVAEATGMSRTTIRAGRNELRQGVTPSDVIRVRRAGAGRPSIEATVPGVVDALERLIKPVTRGDLASPLRWTTKSTTRLSMELARRRFPASPQTVGQLLHARGYRLRGAIQPLHGVARLDRDKQFAFINEQAKAFQAHGLPVIAVATENKHLAEDELDRIRNVGGSVLWSRAGDHHAPALASRAVTEWWDCMEKRTYPEAKALLIIVDGAGTRMASRQWKTELQPLVDRTGLVVSISHLPPGTSKWSKIEHRLICHVIEHWRGHPPVDHETVVHLIGKVGIGPGLATKVKRDARERSAHLVESVRRGLIDGPRRQGPWNYLLVPHRGPAT
jgi:hypothetical protein